MWPIWLLDIDGVINADPFKVPTHVWPEDQWMIRMVEDSRGKAWKITAAQPVLDFINRVHNHKWAEVVWLTTWQRGANNVSDALGIPRLPVIENPMERSTRYAGRDWWKLAEFFKQLSLGRPIVWTDDDISTEILGLTRSGSEVGGPQSFLVSPKGSEGLGPWHLKKIAKFLNIPDKWEV